MAAPPRAELDNIKLGSFVKCSVSAAYQWPSGSGLSHSLNIVSTTHMGRDVTQQCGVLSWESWRSPLFEELTKSVKAQLYDRVSSPLMGTFIVSWALCNYRFILALASSMAFADKITYIDSILFPTWWDVFWHGIGMPAIATAFVIFIYPYPARAVYNYHRRRQVELKRLQQLIDDDTPITQEEAKELRLSVLQSDQRFVELVKKKDLEIDGLKRQVESYMDKFIPLGKTPTIETEVDVINRLVTVLESRELSVLNHIYSKPKLTTFEELHSRFDGLDRLGFHRAIDILAGHNLIKRNSEDGDARIVVTTRGRAVLEAAKGKKIQIEISPGPPIGGP